MKKERIKTNLEKKISKKIVHAYESYKTIEKFAYVSTKKEIQENDYNLNIPRYVDSFEEDEMVDMEKVAENIVNIKSEIEEVEAQMKKYLEELGL